MYAEKSETFFTVSYRWNPDTGHRTPEIWHRNSLYWHLKSDTVTHYAVARHTCITLFGSGLHRGARLTSPYPRWATSSRLWSTVWRTQVLWCPTATASWPICWRTRSGETPRLLWSRPSPPRCWTTTRRWARCGTWGPLRVLITWIVY